MLGNVRLLFALSSANLLLCAVYRAVDSIFWAKPWADVRLAPTFAIRQLGELYATPDEGAILCTLYPPLAYLYYLPVTIFSTPDAAIIAASLLSSFSCLAVVAWACLDSNLNDCRDRELGALAFLFVGWHLYAAQSLAGVWTNHADAPAYVFGLAGCLLAVRGKPGWAAAIASCAVWSKQTAAPILLALAAFYWFRNDRRGGARFLATALATNIVLLALFSWQFGFERMWFGMFTVASRQPVDWRYALRIEDVIATSLDLAVLVTLLVFISFAAGKSIRELIPSRAWLFLGAAIALAPLGVLGRIKAGGELNNYGMPQLWLVVGLALALLSVCARFPEWARPAKLTLALVIGLQMLSSAPDALTLIRTVPRLDQSPERQAYEFARAHPEEGYLPWRPLATIMATGQLRHSAFCVWDWELADIELGNERFRANLPKNLRLAAFQNFAYDPDHALMRRLPELSCKTELDELPGWAVFQRCD